MRLIDADALLKALKDSRRYNEDIPIRAEGIDDAIIDVLSAPAIDAKPVVRCKDCKHVFQEEDCYFCTFCARDELVMGTDYCSYGEVNA